MEVVATIVCLAFSIDIGAFTCAENGANTVTLTAIDSSGNNATCTATVTVLDTIPPVITQCPPDFTVQGCSVADITSGGQTSLTFSSGFSLINLATFLGEGGTFTDNCSPHQMIQYIDAQAGTYPTIVTRTFIVTGLGGNKDTCMQTITIADTIPPTALCLDTTLYVDASGSTSVTAAELDGGSSDVCTPVTLAIDISNFDCTSLGDNTVTLTVTDSSGNSSTCTSTVTVLDTIAPILTCIADTTVDTDPGVCTADLILDQPDVSDNCSVLYGDDTVVLRLPQFVPEYTRGDTKPNDEATGIDRSTINTGGNGSVLRAVAPNIELTQSLDHSIVPGTVSCNYNIGGQHTNNSYIRLYDLPALGYTNEFDITGVSFGVESATSTSGTQPVVINVYSYNTADPFIFGSFVLEGSVTATVADGTLYLVEQPIFASIPVGSALVVEIFTPDGQAANNTLFIGSNPNGQTGSTYIAAADCGIPEPTDMANIGFPTVHTIIDVISETEISLVNDYNNTDDASDTYPIGSTTVTWTATDGNGNSSTCSHVVTVEDNEDPIALCIGDTTIYLDASGNGSITANEVDNGSSDNCSIDSISIDITCI